MTLGVILGSTAPQVVELGGGCRKPRGERVLGGGRNPKRMRYALHLDSATFALTVPFFLTRSVSEGFHINRSLAYASG